MQPLELGGRRGRHRVGAALLPAGCKPRLLGVLMKLCGACRAAAGRAAGLLRASAKGEAALEGPAVEGCGAVALLRAFIEEGGRLQGQLEAWVAAERQHARGAAALLKRLPAAVFAMERLDVAMYKLIRQVRRGFRLLWVSSSHCPPHCPNPTHMTGRPLVAVARRLNTDRLFLLSLHRPRDGTRRRTLRPQEAARGPLTPSCRTWWRHCWRRLRA
jgi:hypothetical protein